MTRSSLLGPAVGVDLGGTKVVAGLVAADGKVVARHRADTRPRRGAKAVLAQLAASIDTLCQAHGVAASLVGVAIAGQSDSTRGILHASPNLPGWREVRVAAALERALGVPAVVTNDVRAAAWGEWTAGAGRGAQSLVALWVGTGIGGGVALSGRMLEGASGTAGELGHQTIVAEGGHKCHCPNRGCLEAYAGGWAIARRAREAAQTRSGAGPLKRLAGSVSAITAETVAQAYRRRDPLARQIVRETADFLGAGMANAANLFNPDRIILGGGVIEGIPDLVRLADRAMRRRALRAALAPLRVVRDQLGADASVVGAASYARARVLGSGRPASGKARRV